MESKLVVPDDFQKFCSLLPRKALVSLSMHDLREIWGISKQREHKAWDRAREMRVTSGCPDFCGEVDGQTMSHETFEEWKRESATESEANWQASKDKESK